MRERIVVDSLQNDREFDKFLFDNNLHTHHVYIIRIARHDPSFISTNDTIIDQ